jgi:hypothetical protein
VARDVRTAVVAAVVLECTGLELARTALASVEAALERTGLAVAPIGARNSSSCRDTAAALAPVEEAPWSDIDIRSVERLEAPSLDTTSTRLGSVVPLVPQFARCLEDRSKASVWCPARMRALEPKNLAPEEQMTLVAHSAM